MNTLLNYPGSKQLIKDWIISFIPKHQTYLEPYFGSGTIFFNKEQAKIEVINDIDQDIYNYFKVLRDKPDAFIENIILTPFSIKEYKNSRVITETDSDIEKARKFAIKCWFGIGNSAVYQSGFRRSKSSTSSNKCKTWNKLPETMQIASSRLKNAVLENDDAINIIKKYNNPDVFIYCDPPYVLSTRKEHLYKHDMTDEQHIELLRTLKEHKGKVLISCYNEEIYSKELAGWHKETIETAAERGKRTECLYMNYLPQPSLFDIGELNG
ncbi:MAG: DNA adenine methylase [Beduini sp.]|uniref:DNA adenine methylase n=1 Tax=Beduini sp. TaxID=1922300 RepID=UPI00399FDFFB